MKTWHWLALGGLGYWLWKKQEGAATPGASSSTLSADEEAIQAGRLASIDPTLQVRVVLNPTAADYGKRMAAIMGEGADDFDGFQTWTGAGGGGSSW